MKRREENTENKAEREGGRGVPIMNTDLIFDFLKKNHRTQIKMADDLRIARPHFNNLINQKSRTSLDILLDIGEYIGVEWWRLLVPPAYAVVPTRDADFIRVFREMQSGNKQT